MGEQRKLHAGFLPFVIAIALLISPPLFAGFMGMPLKAELDLADRVVVGRITRIDRITPETEEKVVWGRATVSVSQTLKGEKSDEITMTVVMHLDREREMQMQSPPRVYHVGDEGIWIIGKDGNPLHDSGLQPKDRLEEIKADLAELGARKWSDEANGLKVWASAEMKNPTGRWLGRAIFAVQNVSDRPVYLPLSIFKGVVRAVAIDAEGKEFPLRGIGDQIDGRPPLKSQRVLQPGEIRYLHPDGENYGSFGIPRDLPPGRYSIRIMLTNGIAQGRLGVGRGDNPVTLWTGSVTAPEVTVEVPEVK